MLEQAASAAMMSSVHIARWRDCSVPSLEGYLDSSGLIPTLRAAKAIVIKVSLPAGQTQRPESGVVTNPTVLRWLVETLVHVSPKARIHIAESDSIGRGFAAEKFRFQGYSSLFSDLPGVQLADLSHSPVKVYACLGRHFKQGVVLASLFGETDFLISLAKMKTHNVSVMTGCLKNQFGCLPDSDKDKYHPYLPAVITDVNSALRPGLSLLEACPALEGNGPIFGKPRDLGIILMGTDPVAVDATAARIMGLGPQRIALIKEAAKGGIGVWEAERIEITGEPLRDVCTSFSFIPSEQRIYVGAGLAIQRVADLLHAFGHRVHLIKGTVWAIQKVVGRIKKGLLSATRRPSS
jgi:uncharacterized protein (DUF362 family)